MQISYVRLDNNLMPPLTYNMTVGDNQYIGIKDFISTGTGSNTNYNVNLIPDINPFVYRDMMESLNKISNIADNMPSTSYYEQAVQNSVLNGYTYLFHYSNSVWSDINTDENNNQYLIRYEDIKGISKSSSEVKLTSDVAISDFISVLDKENTLNNNIKDQKIYTGGFLYPDIKSINNLLTDGGERSSLLLKPGKSVTIPITFEYYINKDNNDSSSQNSISKSIIFAIKDSLSSAPKYYEIEITGNNTIQELNTIFSNIDSFELSDSITADMQY